MDFVAELGNPALQAMDNPVFLPLIERRGAAFLIDLAGIQQRIDDHENLMRHRHNRFLLPATPDQSPEPEQWVPA